MGADAAKKREEGDDANVFGEGCCQESEKKKKRKKKRRLSAEEDCMQEEAFLLSGSPFLLDECVPDKRGEEEEEEDFSPVDFCPPIKSTSKTKKTSLLPGRSREQKVRPCGLSLAGSEVDWVCVGSPLVSAVSDACSFAGGQASMGSKPSRERVLAKRAADLRQVSGLPGSLADFCPAAATQGLTVGVEGAASSVLPSSALYQEGNKKKKLCTRQQKVGVSPSWPSCGVVGSAVSRQMTKAGREASDDSDASSRDKLKEEKKPPYAAAGEQQTLGGGGGGNEEDKPNARRLIASLSNSSVSSTQSSTSSSTDSLPPSASSSSGSSSALQSQSAEVSTSSASSVSSSSSSLPTETLGSETSPAEGHPAVGSLMKGGKIPKASLSKKQLKRLEKKQRQRLRKQLFRASSGSAASEHAASPSAEGESEARGPKTPVSAVQPTGHARLDGEKQTTPTASDAPEEGVMEKPKKKKGKKKKKALAGYGEHLVRIEDAGCPKPRAGKKGVIVTSGGAAASGKRRVFFDLKKNRITGKLSWGKPTSCRGTL